MATRLDLIEFWRRLPAASFVHPADASTLATRAHRLKTDHLPVPWWGALKTARVFLLYLNPGYVASSDLEEAGDKLMMRLRRRRLAGEDVEREVVARHRERGSAFEKWFDNKLSGVCKADAIERDLCVLNLVAYKSPTFRSYGIIKHLPSTKQIRQVVSDELLPGARSGDFMLVVARGARHWGVQPDDQCPTIWVLGPGYVRGGLVRANSPHGRAVRDFLARDFLAL